MSSLGRAKEPLKSSAQRLTVYQKYLYKLSLSWESERVIIGQVLPPVFAMINSPPLTRKSLLALPICKDCTVMPDLKQVKLETSKMDTLSVKNFVPKCHIQN